KVAVATTGRDGEVHAVCGREGAPAATRAGIRGPATSADPSAACSCARRQQQHCGETGEHRGGTNMSLRHRVLLEMWAWRFAPRELVISASRCGLAIELVAMGPTLRIAFGAPPTAAGTSAATAAMRDVVRPR